MAESAALVVAIDGAAGSGKSTLARGLALLLGIPYVNTGLMYRALAALTLERGADPANGDALAELVRALRFTLSSSAPPELEVGGARPGPELRTIAVESVVSQIASHPQVRRRMVDIQRSLGAHGGVIEGRDIASVVFPGAIAKIFLTASPGVRAERRAREREGDPGGVAAALHARDSRDEEVNPHVPVPDAVIIDTTHTRAGDVLEAALALVLEAREAGA